jgi:four helix bundle protein
MEQVRRNPLKEKSYEFALMAAKCGKRIMNDRREFVLSKQFIRSGTSIGANVEEANHAESTNDFIHKLSIANKESYETHYWIRLLRDTNEIPVDEATDILGRCEELIKMLTSSINTTKRRNNKPMR